MIALAWPPLPVILGCMSEMTRVLKAMQKGDAQAANQLLVLVHGELRKLAAQKMANEKAGHTLQPTALVHEAYLRCHTDRRARWTA